MPISKVVLYSTHPHEVRPLLQEVGITELPMARSSKPEMVVTFGGDGTFFTAEREWPGVPKLIMRRSRVCTACMKAVPRKILEHVATRAHTVKEFPKVVFAMGLTEGIATNDIILRNWNPNQALRFGLEDVVGAECPRGEIIGDGLVLATPIGARAYFRSITRDPFTSKFGLAFNNPTKLLDPVPLADDFSITVRILRENGLLCLDNLPSFWFLREGDRFTIKRHHEVTRVVDLLEYYCQVCQQELTIAPR